MGAAALAAAQVSIDLVAEETAGVRRRGVVVSQGVPAEPMPADAVGNLRLRTAAGAEVPALIEADGQAPAGKVRWLRVAARLDLAPNQRLPLRLETGPRAPAAPLSVRREGETIEVTGPRLRLRIAPPARVSLWFDDQPVLDGPLRVELFPDARSIINAGGRTTVLSPFEPGAYDLDQPTPHRATVRLRGRCPKQKPYNYQPGNNDPTLGFDVEVRFHLSALTGAVDFDWRAVNQTGYKSWLERYALVLPLATGLRQTGSERTAGGPSRWLQLQRGEFRVGVTAPFAQDLGEGGGVALEGGVLAHGGLRMPPDGGFGGLVPEIRRVFYEGTTRTFAGTLCPGECAPAEVDRPHFVLSPEWYSRLGLLPEAGDRPLAREFARPVARSAQWLLDRQWRGTLWWGEWWREWDATRAQGAEEASNGQSLLAPLYHYFRTGDRRFLDAASRAAWFVYDVQQTRRRSGFGPMLHTRRHLLDELDWIHPRYQRMAGPLLASRVLLAGREREELAATLRHFVTQIQAEDGTPYNWDERANRRAASETGVDTANIIESLVAAWRETGDPFFLDRARGYARWTVQKWRTRQDDTFWNWNLTRYVLTGLLAICREAERDPSRIPERESFRQAAIEIGRHTLTHPELAAVAGTIAGGELHYVFYHAWLGAEVSRLAGDPTLLKPLLGKVREQMARQALDGSFPMEMGSLWSQYPHTVVSYYDPKSVVAYIPVLEARLAALERQ